MGRQSGLSNGGGYGKLAGKTGCKEVHVNARCEIRVDELVVEQAETLGMDVLLDNVWRVPRALDERIKRSAHVREDAQQFN